MTTDTYMLLREFEDYYDSLPEVELVLTLLSGKEIRKKMNLAKAFSFLESDPLIGVVYKKARIENLGDFNMRQFDTSI